jgi:cell division protein FtsB
VGVFQTLQVAAQIADLENANDAKQRRIDELEERVNALVARMEAVENA